MQRKYSRWRISGVLFRPALELTRGPVKILCAVVLEEGLAVLQTASGFSRDLASAPEQGGKAPHLFSSANTFSA